MEPQGLIGIAVIVLVAWLLSENRRTVSWRPVAIGLVLQFALALLLLRVPPVRDALLQLNAVVDALQSATEKGTRFVFGYLGGGPPPFEEVRPGESFILAFQALPLVLLMSVLSAILFHWRVLPLVVQGLSWALRRLMGVSGALGLGVAANVFVGMVEAPLLIRPYVTRLSRSELFALMTVGMATIAGTVMVLYANFLTAVVPGAIGHILTASVISVPAALLVSLLMVPETEPGQRDVGSARLTSEYGSTMEALVGGASQGVTLLINITAMLLVLVALVALVNLGLGWLPNVADAPLSLQRLLGWVLAPLAWAIGVPWADAETAGMLLGTKVVLNEFIAYVDLAGLPAEALTPRSRLILVYAMCGFANFASLGIMLAGLTTIAPDRRPEILVLGPRSILSGLLATCMTGAVVGII